MLRVRLSLALSLALTGCAAHPPEAPFTLLAPKPGPADWSAAFAAPKPIEVLPLRTGEVRVARSVLIDLENPALANREDERIWVPVMAYLVRHTEHGDWLLDSGFDASFTGSGHGNFGGLARFVEVTRQTPGCDVASLVRQAGADPARLRGVLISHFHGDHTAGLPALPPELPLVGGPDARAGYEVPWYAPFDHLAGHASIQALDFAGLPDGGPGPSLDLFGDGSLFVVHAPGHAPGNLSVVVNGLRGPVLLTFDASHLREGFEAGVAPGKAVDRAAAERTLARLRAFRDAHPRLRVVPGHEASAWDRARGVQDPL